MLVLIVIRRRGTSKDETEKRQERLQDPLKLAIVESRRGMNASVGCPWAAPLLAPPPSCGSSSSSSCSLSSCCCCCFDEADFACSPPLCRFFPRGFDAADVVGAGAEVSLLWILLPLLLPPPPLVSMFASSVF